MTQEEIERHALAVAQDAIELDITVSESLDEHVANWNKLMGDNSMTANDRQAIYDTISDRVKVVLDD